MKFTDEIRKQFESKPRSLPQILFALLLINENPPAYFLEQEK